MSSSPMLHSLASPPSQSQSQSTPTIHPPQSAEPPVLLPQSSSSLSSPPTSFPHSRLPKAPGSQLPVVPSKHPPSIIARSVTLPPVNPAPPPPAHPVLAPVPDASASVGKSEAPCLLGTLAAAASIAAAAGTQDPPQNFVNSQFLPPPPAPPFIPTAPSSHSPTPAPLNTPAVVPRSAPLPVLSDAPPIAPSVAPNTSLDPSSAFHFSSASTSAPSTTIPPPAAAPLSTSGMSPPSPPPPRPPPTTSGSGLSAPTSPSGAIGTPGTPGTPQPSTTATGLTSGGKPKQRRYRATPEQLRHLIARFDVNPSPSSTELQELANNINMPAQSAILWFKNRRARVPHKRLDKAATPRRREIAPGPTSTNGSHLAPVTTTRTVASPPNLRVMSRPPLEPLILIRPPTIFSNPRSPPTVPRRSYDPHPASAPNVHPPLLPPSPEAAAAASMAELAMADLQPSAQTPPPPPTSGPPPPPPLPPPLPPLQSNSNAAPLPPPLPPAPPNSTPRISPPSETEPSPNISSKATDLEKIRRLRSSPPTPRLQRQREYTAGDHIEVLELGRGICRAWYSGRIISRARIQEANGGRNVSLNHDSTSGDVMMTDEKDNSVETGKNGAPNNVKDLADGRVEMIRTDSAAMDNGGLVSSRAVRSPSRPMGTSSVLRTFYLVEYEHRENDGGEKLREEVGACLIRPEPPRAPSDMGGVEWRPEVGEAVEVLRDSAWCVGVVQNFVVRKGYMISFETGSARWVRRPSVRPYQIWRSGDRWVTKLKPPLPLVRKSVGLSVTYPPGGKRKRVAPVEIVECGNGEMIAKSIAMEQIVNGADVLGSYEARMRKRSRSGYFDGTGPDGLPEGWRRDFMRRSGFSGSRGQTFYIAPDGQRLKSLKEAQRYVQMMGPV